MMATRVSILKAASAMLALLFLVTTNTSSANKPNIVLFVADDHTAVDCGAYGSRDVRTPNIDRLAKEGMLFRHAFAASPTCMPSRAALFTGLMPMRNGAHANNLRGQSECRVGIQSLPHYLEPLGYRVAQAGKTHFGPKSVFPFERIENSEVPEPGYENNRMLRIDLNANAVDKWLSSVAGSHPFCLVVCDHSPHVIWPEKSEYNPGAITIPPNHIDTPETRKARARYYTDITKMDRNLGVVLTSLEKYGFATNTLFIYTSDQGAQWPFSKWNLYDSGIRVPFIVRWPGKLQPGSSSDAMISLVDVLPTLVEIGGGKSSDTIDGRSFSSVLDGKTNSHRDVIFATHSQDGSMNLTPMRCVRTDRYKYILNLAPQNQYTTHLDKAKDHDGGREYWPSWEAKAAKDPRAAAVVKRYHWRTREELYDIELDPYEVNNLAANPDYASIKQELSSRLAVWRKGQNDKKTGPDPVPVGNREIK